MATKDTALAVLQKTGVSTLPDYMKADGPSDMGGGLGGGGGRNRIGLKGSRFRLIQAGVEEAVIDDSFLDVIVVGANPHVSRMFYKGKYDPSVKIAPTCFSSDGITPHPDVEDKQSEKCNGCPQNVKGSRVTETGAKTRACSFSKRLVIMLDGDDDKELYQMDLKSMSIFGDGIPNEGLYTLAGYNKLLQSKGVRSEAVVTRVSFDTQSSVPKVYFTPSRFLSEKEFKEISKITGTTAVTEMASVDSVTLQPDQPDSTHPVGSTVPSKKAGKKDAKIKVEEVPTTDDDELAAALKDLED
jgi:hypothetical protein